MTSELTTVTNDLKNLSKSESIASYVTSIVAVVIGLMTLLHPSFREPVLVQTLVPSISVTIAGIVQTVELITHRQLKTAVVKTVAGTGVVTK